VAKTQHHHGDRAHLDHAPIDNAAMKALNWVLEVFYRFAAPAGGIAVSGALLGPTLFGVTPSGSDESYIPLMIVLSLGGLLLSLLVLVLANHKKYRHRWRDGAWQMPAIDQPAKEFIGPSIAVSGRRTTKKASNE
jgi:hypothetical protein